MTQAFRDTGLAVRRCGPVRRFQVMGERCSGTNYLARLIARNTALEPVDLLGWKHGFATMLAVPADVAVIGVVRDARAWALSLHARPWHASAAMQALDFGDFIRARWDSVLDRPRYFAGVDPGAVGQPLQADRDPLTGAAFADLFALRAAKLRGLTGLMARDCTAVLTRLEVVQDNPRAWVASLARALEVPRAPAFSPVTRRLGQRFKPAVADRPPTPAAWPAADLAYLHDRIDTEQEAALGYTYA